MLVCILYIVGNVNIINYLNSYTEKSHYPSELFLNKLLTETVLDTQEYIVGMCKPTFNIIYTLGK